MANDCFDFTITLTPALRKETEIYSISIHPTALRFALGTTAPEVSIWSIEALSIAQLALPEGTNAPQANLVAKLTGHTGAVLCVAFSSTGKYLATSSDDKTIHVWEKRPGATTGFGMGASSAGLENWGAVRVIKTTHMSDITGLCWSPNNDFFASTSIDNAIGIWSVADGTLKKRITSHTSTVKGVAWDPLGEYLVTQGDDKCVRIWNVKKDFAAEAVITNHYSAHSTSCFFKRPSWSPDGSLLVTVAGFNERKKFIAVQYTRGKWNEAKRKLCGHKDTVISSAFNPNRYQNNGKPSYIVAIGGEDFIVSVWRDNSDNAVKVFKGRAKGHIRQVAWSGDGEILLFCEPFAIHGAWFRGSFFGTKESPTQTNHNGSAKGSSEPAPTAPPLPNPEVEKNLVASAPSSQPQRKRIQPTLLVPGIPQPQPQQTQPPSPLISADKESSNHSRNSKKRSHDEMTPNSGAATSPNHTNGVEISPTSKRPVNPYSAWDTQVSRQRIRTSSDNLLRTLQPTLMNDIVIPRPVPKAVLTKFLYTQNVDDGLTKRDLDVQLEVVNPAMQSSSKIQCTRGAAILWKRTEASRVCAIGGDRRIACYATMNGCLTVLTVHGAIINSGIALDGPIAYLDVAPGPGNDLSKSTIVAVTCVGQVSVFSFEDGRLISKHQSSAQHLLRAYADMQQIQTVGVGPKLVIQTSTCLGIFDETSRQWDHMPIVGHPKSLLVGCDFDTGAITCKYLARMQPNLKVDGTTSNMSPEDATIQHIMQLLYVARYLGSDTEAVMFLQLLFEKLESFNRREQMEECFLSVQDGTLLDNRLKTPEVLEALRVRLKRMSSVYGRSAHAL